MIIAAETAIAPETQQIITMIAEAAAALVAGFVISVLQRIFTHFGLKNIAETVQIDDRTRAYVLTALNNATSSAIANLLNRDDRVVYIIDYLRTHVPDGLARLGIDGKLQSLAEAAIDRATVKPPAGTTEGTIVSPPPKT